jgi:hypothetical protein
VVSDANVITPDNMAVAINAACAVCDTRGLAMQLIATTGPLSDHTISSLLEAWKPLADLERKIASSSIAEIQTQLFQVESQILGILTSDHALMMPATGSQQSAGAATTAPTTTTASTGTTATTGPDDTPTTVPDNTTTTAPDNTTTTMPDNTTTTVPDNTTTTAPDNTTTTMPVPTESSTAPPTTASG